MPQSWHTEGVLQVTVFGCLKKSLAWKILEVPVYWFSSLSRTERGENKNRDSLSLFVVVLNLNLHSYIFRTLQNNL
jgi:hypothetical protein